MSIVVCGSVAYDSIMVFQDRFKNHILPEQIHILNISFLVPEMRREFGGCAGNIAYNLHLLGDDPLIVGTVGDDAQQYRERLETLGLRQDYLRHVQGTYTAQAFITTDLDDNQITAFHPGAMMYAHQNLPGDIPGARLAIVAPDGAEGMVSHAEGLAAAGVPFVFDPGQALPILNASVLKHCLQLARYCTANDYEIHLICEKTGLSVEEIAAMLDALIVTLGAKGSYILTRSRRIDIPAVEADAIVDPTGCGDAFRAGLLHGIDQGWEWLRCGRLATLMGAIKIAHRGAQNHTPSHDEIGRRYQKTFGEVLW